MGVLVNNRDFVNELLDSLDEKINDAMSVGDDEAEKKWRLRLDGATSVLAALIRQKRHDARKAKA